MELIITCMYPSLPRQHNHRHSIRLYIHVKSPETTPCAPDRLAPVYNYPVQCHHVNKDTIYREINYIRWTVHATAVRNGRDVSPEKRTVDICLSVYTHHKTQLKIMFNKPRKCILPSQGLVTLVGVTGSNWLPRCKEQPGKEYITMYNSKYTKSPRWLVMVSSINESAHWRCVKSQMRCVEQQTRRLQMRNARTCAQYTRNCSL